MNKLPLHGIRVADFTWIGAGSFTTKLLADLGADVIKIESHQRVDSLRESKPFQNGIPGLNRSGYFADRNSSKRSITLNMKTEQGRTLARELVRQSDIVANNFTPGTMEKFGLGYPTVKHFKPDIIYLAMSMQGETGPESQYLGYGLTMGAVTGLHYLAGHPDREPAGTGTNYPDHVPNPTHAAFALLAALRHRRRTGNGQMIDLAQIEPTISLLGPAVMDYTVNGVIAERAGNQHVAGVPYGVYPTTGEDRWIAIAATHERQWFAMLDVLGADALRVDARFAEATGRWERRHELDLAIGQLTSGRDGLQLMKQLQRAGVPAGVVNSAADVLRVDPQLRHRGHWAYLEHPEMGRSVYNGLPFKLSRTPVGPTGPAPLLGQHTDEICRRELGLSNVEIEVLRSEGALY